MRTHAYSERDERLSTAASQAHSLVTLLVAWHSVPEEQRGSVLGEYHLFNVLAMLQQSTQQLVADLLRPQ